MSKRTTLTAEGTTLPVNLRTRSTGTVHAVTAAGTPLCPARAAAGMESTSAPVSCRSCLKLQPLEVVELQEQPAEVGVRGTVDHGNGPQVRTYTGTDAVGMLAELRDVQRRQGGAVDAVVVSRVPGGDWRPVAAVAPGACPEWCVVDHSNGVDVEHVGELETVAAPEGAEVEGGDGEIRTVEVVAQLRQDPGGAPTFVLGVCLGVECDVEAEMPVDEAERLVERLQTLITAARS
ncbi:hypothetical protein ABZV14_01130 [Streptosporangium canum]|uniref:DUF6907 domain-containing protein n=1 Tax=Streptosporangium canum TaxID=324952 RepID=UPI00339F4355